MKVEIEKTPPLTLVHIYFRNNYGRTMDTISDVKGLMLFDNEENWIGVKLYNVRINGEEFEIPAMDFNNEEHIKVDDEKSEITILFDLEAEVHISEDEVFYIDYNENGVYGLEVILKSEDIKTTRMTHFISNI